MEALTGISSPISAFKALFINGKRKFSAYFGCIKAPLKKRRNIHTHEFMDCNSNGLLVFFKRREKSGRLSTTWPLDCKSRGLKFFHHRQYFFQTNLSSSPDLDCSLSQNAASCYSTPAIIPPILLFNSCCKSPFSIPSQRQVIDFCKTKY